MMHRRDIDGLRAIAVLPVILFHSDLGICSGGYVGVDVFFVISGFLITGILRDEIEGGTFSIVAFYERRIRRLLPALFGVLAAAFVAGWMLLAPDELRELGQSSVATTFFASNLYFWLESGYFQRAAEELPLLHTWSLAVEEQYYVIFPVFLYMLSRLGRSAVIAGLTVLSLLSLGSAIVLVDIAPDHAFYLAHTRAWELFLGAFLAYNIPALPATRMSREIIALLGLAGIGSAVVLFDSQTPFPGLAALLPCLGAAAVIYAGMGGQTLVGRILGTRAFVGVGLISYSLYLWHWPVFVFLNHYTITAPTLAQTVFAITFIFVAATFSWRYIERPFRGRQSSLSRRPLFASAAAAAALLATLGLAAHLNAGFPERFSAHLLASTDTGVRDSELRDECFGFDVMRLDRGRLCQLGNPDVAPDFLLWGDSHSLSALNTISDLAATNLRGGLYVGASGCAPLLGIQMRNRSTSLRQRCAAATRRALKVLESSPSIKTVLIIARWPLYIEARGFGHSQEDPVLFSDARETEPDVSNNPEIIERGLHNTAEEIVALGKRLVFLESIPEIEYDVPAAVMRSNILEREVSIGPSVTEVAARQERTQNAFGRLVEKFPELEVIPVHDVLCDERSCAVKRDGKLLYYDANHLSEHGASLLVDRFAEALRIVL